MATRVLGLASTLLLARILVPSDFGLIAMATAFSAAIDSLSSLGLQDALVRRPDSDRGLFDTAFSMQAARGLFTAAIIGFGAAPASQWFAEPRLMPILLILAALSALAGFENIGIIEFRRSLRFDVEFRLLFIPRIAQVVVTAGIAFAARSYWALVAGIAVSKLLRLALTYRVHPYRPRIRFGRWRELVGFSFWTWAASLAMLVWERADPIVLGPVIGPAGLGAYLLAGEIGVLPITELVAPAAAALFAGFAAVQTRGTETVGMAFSIAATLLLLIVPLAIGVSGTSGYIVAALLGPKWEIARPLIAVFSLLCAFSPFSFVCSSVLVARGHVRRNFFGIGMAAVSKGVVLAVVISITSDLLAFAAAAVACTVIEATCFIIQLRRVGDIRFRDCAGGLLRTTIAGVFAAAALYATGYGWRPVTLASGTALLFGGLLGCFVLVSFAAGQAALWLIAGRPQGPETKVLAIAQPFLARWVRAA